MSIIHFLVSIVSLAEAQIYVDANAEEPFNGTEARPYATLEQALEHVDGATRIRIKAGDYRAPESGWIVPGGVHLLGDDIGNTRLFGPCDVLIRSKSGGEALSLERLGFRGEGSGVAILVSETSWETLQLRSVHIEGFERAVSTVRLKSLKILDCVFENNTNGLVIENGDWEGLNEDSTTLISGSKFRHQSECGILRMDDVPTSTTSLFEVQDCVFSENDVGVHFQKPTGNHKFSVSGSEFLKNTHYGIRAVGGASPVVGVSRVERCGFRENGIGAYVINLQTPLSLAKCRFTHSTGAGLVVGNFISDPTHVTVSNSLCARNGADGIQAISDGDSLLLKIVQCTLVDNAAYGIRGKAKHGGSLSSFVDNCLIWNNAMGDIDGLPLDIIRSSWLSHDADSNEPSLRDPCFVDPGQCDYRLTMESPVLDQGDPTLVGDGSETDLDGVRRIVDGNKDGAARPDPGAYEYVSDQK